MDDVSPPFGDPNVAAKFAGFPDTARAGLLRLRRLIFETAAALPAVGRLEETLKWGQPAYLTPDTRSGSTIRLGLTREGGFAIFTHCQSSIIPDFRTIFPDDFTYEGARGIYFNHDADLPIDKLRLLVSSALTYHVRSPG